MLHGALINKCRAGLHNPPLHIAKRCGLPRNNDAENYRGTLSTLMRCISPMARQGSAGAPQIRGWHRDRKARRKAGDGLGGVETPHMNQRHASRPPFGAN
jgi:hypothetical protein